MSAPEARAVKPREDVTPTSLGLSDADVLDMYYYVRLARAVDDRMWALQRSGGAAFVISGQGHEGAQVGAIYALNREKDWLVPFYRSVAAVLTKGMPAAEIFLIQLGKAADPSSGGRQMPGHYGHRHHKILSTSSPVATQALHAAGIAYAAKVRRTGEIALTELGEGSTSEGDFAEALNFAAIHRLGVIFMVENNGYAISVPLSKQMAVPNVAMRAAGFGLAGVTVDGSHVLQTYAAARDAVARARRGEGPTLLEVMVPRLTAHSSDDSQEKYRSGDEIARDRARDPVHVFTDELRGWGILTDVREQEILSRIQHEIDLGTEMAEEAALPDPATATRHVYAEPPGPGLRV
ncbi:MAG TPA: thiamine pyrophosphate-dependent dehydrogenase E1 component subunit alpha [bacterium]|nr:thiamine pyrophosphate-dependent dehydrogenase E1 component subunit alpha [bacterium]